MQYSQGHVMKHRKTKKMIQESWFLIVFFKLHLSWVICLLYTLRYHPLLPVCPTLMPIFFWNMDKMGSIHHSQPKNIYTVSLLLKHELH